MAAYDREHETNYIETADRYVKNRFNAVKTANELFIHRSTFLYRLERIKAQFGLDLEAEITAPLHLFLSLQYMKKENPEHAK
jgi:DNA-binding PucR family transcriptional regulator